MPERLERIFRGGCLVLAALLILRLGLGVRRATILHHVEIPALPRLEADSATNGTGPASNVVAVVTNAGKTGPANAAANATNGVNAHTTNAALASKPGTNGTNVASAPKAGAKGTNVAGASSTATNATSVASNGKPPGRGRGHPPFGMPGMPGMGGPQPDLPEPVKSQVDRIVKSGLLAPYMPPMPSALLGIADDEAFIRASNGQTGAIKEGAELGGLKLLRIGVNRVLVEEDGEKKELTVFGGAGGESLMPPATNAPSSAPTTNGQTANFNTHHQGREKL